ncbi:prealbumin-like fold domain-containing protein [Methanolapillus ohkumae]|uniref:VWFA domain-containing protein n=1 Tax=Methanolapillus ohkumae TaxID=3028298 RepID=A0AA96VHA6_9EURY|nr:hypothetical protein MsAm2_02850 [Methanosarcinaceae archaeon Am2]
MKNVLKLTALFFVLLFLAAPLASAGGSLKVDGHDTVVVAYGPCSDGSSAYDLNGPVTSGVITVNDYGNITNNQKTQLEDLVTINKEVVESTANDGKYNVTLTVDVLPAELTYNPPPRLDVIIVLDVTSSMLDDIDDNGTPSDQTDDTPIRLRNAQQAIIKSAEAIWAENPESSITIVPFARDVFKPLPTGGFEFNDTKMYTSGSYNPDTSYNTAWNQEPKSYMIGSTSNQTYLGLIAARSSLNAGKGTIFGNDNNHLYYRVTKADVDNMISGMDTFNQSILDIPMGKDTNTEGGLTTAYNFLKTDANFTTNTEQKNRVVILVTDGNAGRYYNSDETIPTSGYNRYEVLTAHQAAENMAGKIKDSTDGNAIIYALGIGVSYTRFNNYNAGWLAYGSASGNEILPENMGTYIGPGKNRNTQDNPESSCMDVAKYLSRLPTSPDHYFNADAARLNMIDYMMAQTVQSSTHFYAPVNDLTIKDQINTNKFTYNTAIPANISINGAPEVVLTTIAGTDVDYADGKININFGEQPAGTHLTAASKTKYVIKYQINPISGLEGGHLHVGVDNKSYVSFIVPDHGTQASDSSKSIYSHPAAKNTYYVPFNTPTVSINSISIIKEVCKINDLGIQQGNWIKSVDFDKNGGSVRYRITIENNRPSTIELDRVVDIMGGTSASAVYLNKSNNNLLEDSNVAKSGTFNYASGVLRIDQGDFIELTYDSDFNNPGTYINMVSILDLTNYPSQPGDYDNPSKGILKTSYAMVTVDSPGGNGSGGGGDDPKIIPKNNTTPEVKGFESDGAQLILEKVDGTDASKKLTATFEIRDGNGNSFSPKMIYTTNAAGHTEKIYLTHGVTYKIYETRAPAGYQMLNEPVTVTVGDDSTVRTAQEFELTQTEDSYTLTIPNTPDDSCPAFRWTWAYLLLGVLVIVQSGLLYKKYKTNLANKWWLLLAGLVLAGVVSGIWFYTSYCQLSDPWIILPTLITLSMIPAVYLYNRYVKVKDLEELN